MRTMDKLAALTVELREYRGGEMLRCMTNLAGTGGDEDSRQLYTFLLHQVLVSDDVIVGKGWGVRISIVDGKSGVYVMCPPARFSGNYPVRKERGRSCRKVSRTESRGVFFRLYSVPCITAIYDF